VYLDALISQIYSKNKFEKLVYLVGFIIRNLTRCTVTWTSNSVSFSLRFPHANQVCTCPPPYVPHAQPTSFFLMWSPNQPSVSTDHWAPHCICKVLKERRYRTLRCWRRRFLSSHNEDSWRRCAMQKSAALYYINP